MRWRRQQERVREIDGWWRDGALRSARGWFRAIMKDEETDENRKCKKTATNLLPTIFFSSCGNVWVGWTHANH